jgi:heme oxygenase
MTILGDITRQKHTEVENLPLIQSLLKGEINEKDYTFYLYDLMFIYDKIETLTKQTGVWSGLEGMERTDSIRKDIEELSPGYSRELCDTTKKYLQYLDSLASNTEKNYLLMAHVYVRHTGDLYGGKLLARSVPGSGLAYQFEDRPGLIKKINSKLSLELSEEANSAFDWFINIFTDMGNRLGYANV